jgi:hypothetical protein
LFALVDACDPKRVHHYGIDLGAGAFTVRCDPAGHQTAFGKWISMRTAFARLDGLAGGPGRLALVVFDSAPAMALMALGPALAPAPTNELDYRTQGNWHSYLLDRAAELLAAGTTATKDQARHAQHHRLTLRDFRTPRRFEPPGISPR